MGLTGVFKGLLKQTKKFFRKLKLTTNVCRKIKNTLFTATPPTN
jgi:hypothetical protein